MVNLDRHFEILEISRRNILGLMDQYSFEQLCLVPEGFNNSILWNAVHNLATQQLLCYKLSDNKIPIAEKFIEPFRKGASGKKMISQDEFEDFKDLFISSINQLKNDYNSGLFAEYTEYTTSYRITLSSIEDAVIFNNVHEGLHLGCIMAIRKFI